jgi:hypothetical protein
MYQENGYDDYGREPRRDHRPAPPPVDEADMLPEASWLPCCGAMPGSFAAICKKIPKLATLLAAACKGKGIYGDDKWKLKKELIRRAADLVGDPAELDEVITVLISSLFPH